MCTPLRLNAFKYAGNVATNVLPSPVAISATTPLCNKAPPTNCTSKCLKPSSLLDASRTAANASTSTSSSVSPNRNRARNSNVFALNSTLVSFRISGSSLFTGFTTVSYSFSINRVDLNVSTSLVFASSSRGRTVGI